MKIALLHRHTKKDIKQTNAAFPYIEKNIIDVLTFKSFDRKRNISKLIKSIVWIFYSPFLVIGKNYDVIYCDDSFPFYAGLVKFVSPRSKVILRMGDFHLMYYTSGLLYKLLHRLEIMSWNYIDGVIAISETMQKKIQSETKTKVYCVLDPVNTSDFKIVDKLPREKVVMFHGLIVKNKGIDVIIETAKMMPDYSFVIIGNGADYKRLASIAPENVLMPGWIPFEELKYHIAIASVGIAIRSKNEGNEYVVTSPWLQYLSANVPCVVSKRKVFDDIGYPYQFTDPESLKDMILKAENQDISKWNRYILDNHEAKKIGYKIWDILYRA